MSNRFELAMRKANLTPKDLQRKMIDTGLTRNKDRISDGINRLLDGGMPNDPGIFRAFSKVTNCSLDYLFGESNTPSKKASAKAVNKYCGLSADALHTIHDAYKEDSDSFIIEMVNILIESGIIQDFVRAYRDYYKGIYSGNVYKIEYNEHFKVDADLFYKSILQQSLLDTTSKLTELINENNYNGIKKTAYLYFITDYIDNLNKTNKLILNNAEKALERYGNEKPPTEQIEKVAKDLEILNKNDLALNSTLDYLRDEADYGNYLTTEEIDNLLVINGYTDINYLLYS